MSKKNIITGVVAALALMLVAVVVLVETGVIKHDFNKEQETIIETSIIVIEETNEFGEIEYITMVTKYSKPKVSSNHRYPTKKTTTTKPTTTAVQFVEQTRYIQETDANGIPLFNDDGTPVTRGDTYTVVNISITQPTATPPITSSFALTGTDGVQITDESGNAVTEVVTYTETTTNLWSTKVEESTTGVFNIQTEVKRDDALAQTIVDQINLDRQAEGLAPLTHSTNLKASARTNSTALALPEIYGNKQNASAYTLITKYGGNPVYQTVAAANKAKIMSPDTTEIGVGVVKYEGQYYTTVIFG